MAEVEPVPDTPSSVTREIERNVSTLKDLSTTTQAGKARDQLAKIGKPAIPRVILAFSQAGDLKEREGMINACVVSDTLHQICGSAAKVDESFRYGSDTNDEWLAPEDLHRILEEISGGDGR